MDLTFRTRKSIVTAVSILFSCTVLFEVNQLQAQDSLSVPQDSIRVVQDSVRGISPIELPRPGSIESRYEYDPILDRYIYTETVGGLDLQQPLILTPEEYRQRVLEEEMNEYFRQKSAALSNYDRWANQNQQSILPSFYVESGLFESIFGGSEIQLIPQGSVEMDMG